MPILMVTSGLFFCFLSDFDMKKDIDTLIAEERAEIISKYDTVRLCTGILFPSSDSDSFTMIFLSYLRHLWWTREMHL